MSLVFIKRNLKVLCLITFLFFCLSLNNNRLYGQIIFSEVMFDVAGADYNDEFIELYNISSAAVDLKGWQFSDSSSSDWLTDAGMGLIIAPFRFAVILDHSYFDHSTTYDEIIPDSTLIITISDNAFGSNGLSNSHGERISLINSSGDTVQNYKYSVDNKPGYSDEKIILNADNSSENWANSLRQGGTPGFRNSVTPYDLDLGFTRNALDFHPALALKSGQTVHISLYLTNTGLRDYQNNVEIKIWLDVQRDSLLQPNEPLIFNEKFNINLGFDADTLIHVDWPAGRPGRYALSARLSSAADQNAFNDFCAKEMTVLESKESLVVNEIKFLTEENQPQWLELYNKGAAPLCLLNWAIADEKDTLLIDSCFFISPGQYKVIAADSGLCARYAVPDSLVCIYKKLPHFNKDGDAIYLLNPGLGWVEQLNYNKNWLEGEDARKPSLERINPQLDSRIPENWGPCTAAKEATPAKVNSIFTPLQSRKLKLSVTPNPFSPDGDGFEDYTVISLNAPSPTARARMEIFDILGRKVRTLLDNRFVGSHYTVVWNGRSDGGTKVRMGIYIIYLQLINDRNGLLNEQKETVVVAGKL